MEQRSKVKKNSEKKSLKYGTTSHPFTGLLICADCGGKPSYREPAEHKEKKYDCDTLLYVNITDIEKAFAVCTTSK